MIAATEVSGPCRGLFQLVEQTKDRGADFVLGMFLLTAYRTCPSIEEAKRRGYRVEVLAQRRRYDVLLCRQALQVVREHHVQILQSHGYKPALLAWLLRRFTGLPWIAFSHGYTSENRRMTVYNRLDLWLLKRADRIVAVSGAMQRSLEQAGVPHGRLRVIYNAVDPAEYAVHRDGTWFRAHCRAGAGDLLVGVIGRLSPEKGQAIFVRAFKDVVRAVPRAKAVMVGDGPERPALQAAVEDAALQDRIVFAGYQCEMTAVYSALDLVVIPSLSEGLPNVLLEALLHRKAVVATRVGGIPEVMDAGRLQWVVPGGDAEHLAGAIIDALRKPDLRSAMGSAGARYVRAVFSPDRRAEQVLALYREVAQISDAPKDRPPKRYPLQG